MAGDDASPVILGASDLHTIVSSHFDQEPVVRWLLDRAQ